MTLRYFILECRMRRRCFVTLVSLFAIGGIVMGGCSRQEPPSEPLQPRADVLLKEGRTEYGTGLAEVFAEVDATGQVTYWLGFPNYGRPVFLEDGNTHKFNSLLSLAKEIQTFQDTKVVSTDPRGVSMWIIPEDRVVRPLDSEECARIAALLRPRGGAGGD